MRLRKMCYIATAISKGDLCDNLNRARAAYFELSKAGVAPFNPALSAFSSEAFKFGGKVWGEATALGHPEMSHADWLEVDFPYVASSHALLRLPGESVGADAEVECARIHNVPVFYTVADVVRYLVGGEVGFV